MTLHDDAEAVFKRFWKRTVPYCAMPLHCVPCQGSSLNAYTKCVPPWYPFSTLCSLHPSPGCNMLHTNLPVRHGTGWRSSVHWDTVQFVLAHSGPHGEVVHRGTLPEWFGTGMVCFRWYLFKRPSGRYGMARFKRVLECTQRNQIARISNIVIFSAQSNQSITCEWQWHCRMI